jgi:integrase
MSTDFKGFKATKPVARLARKDPPEYEVFFTYYDQAGKKYFYRFKRGLNKGPMAERKLNALAFASVLWEGLLKGWNPLKHKFPSFEDELKGLIIPTLGNSLDHCLEVRTKHLSIYTYYGYKYCVKHIKRAAKELGLLDAPLNTVERKDIRTIIATAKEMNGWNSYMRNRYLTWLKTLLSVLVDEEVITINPAAGIKKEQYTRGPGFKRVTDMEKDRIEKHLAKENPFFFEFVMFIYQAGIRRKELHLVQIKDINVQSRTITIRADVAKTNVERVVPLADDLLEIIMHRNVWELPGEYYLFSRDKFKPGLRSYCPAVSTNLWKELVIKGLGINCKMYSLKHKGADDKIEAGIPLEALKNLYGHSSTQMTEIYAQAVKKKHFQEIIEKSPSFTAKVVQMKKAE